MGFYMIITYVCLHFKGINVRLILIFILNGTIRQRSMFLQFQFWWCRCTAISVSVLFHSSVIIAQFTLKSELWSTEYIGSKPTIHSGNKNLQCIQNQQTLLLRYFMRTRSNRTEYNNVVRHSGISLLSCDSHIFEQKLRTRNNYSVFPSVVNISYPILIGSTRICRRHVVRHMTIIMLATFSVNVFSDTSVNYVFFPFDRLMKRLLRKLWPAPRT